MAILDVQDIHTYYGDAYVLQGLSLRLEEGQILGLLGRNGVGKTTLLATVMGHTTFHAGSIEYRGQPISRLAPYARARLGIGYVPQAREIFPSLSVEENLTVAARVNSVSPGRWTLERVYELFPGIASRRAHMGNQISGGEQQMLAIGRALMGNPALLLMDEPLEGLAPIIVEALLRALTRLIREESLAVVLVEQHARLALEVTQQAIVLNRGRISWLGSSTELLAEPARLTNLIVAG